MMIRLKYFLILTGYQITWIACVFSEVKFSQPYLGFYVGIIFLSLYFYFYNNKYKFIKICLLISLPGYFFDSIMVFFKVYSFNSSSTFGLIPLWMIILWFSFSSLFVEIFAFFKNYKFLGIILSGFLGTLTYYFGVPIGVIEINFYFVFFISMFIFWSFLMLYYLEILL